LLDVFLHCVMTIFQSRISFNHFVCHTGPFRQEDWPVEAMRVVSSEKPEGLCQTNQPVFSGWASQAGGSEL